MKSLWTYIEKKNWNINKKYRIALLILGSIYALVGLTLWLLIGIRVLPTRDWMACFIGYPVVLSWFVAFIYSCNHDFHDGK